MTIEATTWVSKEQLLQDWLPRLWDALKDVRHKENAAAEETLYELYVEMKQETLAEKLDTMSQITPEDQLSAVIAELQATQKRLADTENILCHQHFKQEPVAFKFVKGELCYKSREDDQSFGMWCPVASDFEGTEFYISPPQRQPLTDEQERKVARLFSDRVAEMCNVDADDHWKYHFDGVLADVQFVLKAAHGITGEQK